MKSRFTFYLIPVAFFLFLSGFILTGKSFSQSAYLPIENASLFYFESLIAKKNSEFHSSVKPFLKSDLWKLVNLDSLERNTGLTGRFHKKRPQQELSPKQERYVEAAPLFSLYSGLESTSSGKNILSGTAIGAFVNVNLGKKLFFNSDFLTANSGLPQYISNYADSLKVVPGEGYAFPTDLGYHYKNFSGYCSYSPSDVFNFQLGHGKNFIGNGYRSLLLSDIANNYSYLKITTSIWKIKYVNLFANFKDIRVPSRNYFQFDQKFGTFHYLSWNLSKWLNLGFFESVIWQGKDTLNKRGFDVNYLNPVIFYRPVEYSVGSADNSLMGLNLNIKITDKIQFYSQVVIDEFLLKEIRANSGWWANKYGGQAGIKYFDPFGLKGFYLQAELNEVRPYTYSHGSALQNYAHFNQPLAHPLGANFSEVLGIIRYYRNSFSIEIKTAISQYGADTAGFNFGGDIYKNYNSAVNIYGNRTGQGDKQYLAVNEINANYLLIPRLNLRLEAGITERIKYLKDMPLRSMFFFIGLKTGLYNIYRDYM